MDEQILWAQVAGQQRCGGGRSKMVLYATSFVTGAVLGAVFQLLGIPIPAPRAFAGVLGIFGIFCGYLLVK